MTTNTIYTHDSEKFLYPEVKQGICSHQLKVSSLHTIYYEVCGNPQGVPVLFLHGGPGSGCNPSQRRFFDPNHYRIILLDQRGCGNSTPLGCVEENTTAHLVADIEALRGVLGISSWILFGGSWGSTLALSYAVAFPHRIMALVLRGIFLASKQEIAWFLGGSAYFYPEAWQNLIAGLSKTEQRSVLDTYAQRIFSDDLTVSIPAARQWNAFEFALLRLTPENFVANDTDNAMELARARIQLHYIRHGCFITATPLLKATKRLKHIPVTIVQGRYDMVCPPISAWKLARAMPHAQLQIQQHAGHSTRDEGMSQALVAAMDRLKSYPVSGI